MESQPQLQPTDAPRQQPRIPWGEWTVALAFLGVGIIVLLDGLSQAVSRSASGVGAGFMPKVVGAIVIALSLALGLQILRGRLGEPETAEGDVDIRTTRWVPLATCIAAAVIFITAIESLGYLVVSTLAFWLTTWAMGGKHHVRSFLIGAVLSVIVFLVFTQLLHISLPAGIFEGVI